MVNFSDEQILKGILRNDSLVLQFIYKEYYYSISSFVRKNQGDEHDANDIFQEAVIVIYRKLKENSLVLENQKFPNYLYAISRILWLKQLEKRRIEKQKISDTIPFRDDVADSGLNELIEKNERYGLYQKHFKDLGPDCQKILQMFFEKVSLKIIAQRMGFKSEIYAKKRKYKCKEQLIERIKLDPEYKKILQNDG
jgi:RNA polymerase sigma factor (sigma-70 family)